VSEVDGPDELGDAELMHVEPEIAPKKSRLRWAVEGTITASVVLLLFVYVIPTVAGSSYDRVWDVLADISLENHALMFFMWTINIVTYAPMLVSVTPGLNVRKALTANLASSAVSNVLPFGGAAGIGATFYMYREWGIGVAVTARSVLLSGIWNIFLKFGLPVAALFLLVASHEITRALVIVAAIGALALGLSVAAFVLVIRSDALARFVGEVAERTASWVLKLFRRPPIQSWDAKLVEFRHDSATLVAKCWKRTTFWAIVYNVTQFGVLWACLLATGVDSSPSFMVKAFAAFAFGRLLSAIPITPSGLGFVETGLAFALKKAGGDADAITAAVLLFSAYTYLIELPTGAAGWLVFWRARSWRKPVPA
jgi:uncharacterized protein (TIRG00374 family)